MILTLGILTGCSFNGVDKDTIHIHDPQITWQMVEEIIVARGGKSPTDIWDVDTAADGDIRIR